MTPFSEASLIKIEIASASGLAMTTPTTLRASEGSVAIHAMTIN